MSKDTGGPAFPTGRTSDKDALLRKSLIMLGGIEETYSSTLSHEIIREIDRLCDRITAALAEPQGDGWIKCSERLPEPDKDDIAVLVEIVRGEKRSYGYYAHQKWVDLITDSGGWDVGITDVTHWRPLPPLPRSE